MLDFRGRTKDDAKREMTRLWLRQAYIALALAGFGCFFVESREILIAILCGLLWGLLDNALIIGSTVKGFGMLPEASRKLLIKVYFYRLVTGVSIIVGMLGLKLRVAETFFGFIILHIFFILSLKNFTVQKK